MIRRLLSSVLSSVQPTRALRIASMPVSTSAKIGSSSSNELPRDFLTSSPHARATESAPTIETLPCSECADRYNASRSEVDRAFLTACSCAELSPIIESMSCATRRCDPRDSSERRCWVTSRAGSDVVFTLLLAIVHMQPLQAVAAKFDQLLCRRIGRKFFRQAERAPIPIAYDIFILVARARKIAAIPIQIAEPEVRERERVIQIQRTPQRLQRILGPVAPRRNHPEE